MSTPEAITGSEPVEQQTVLINSSSIRASLSLAEPILFLYGFSKSEQRERPPAILRGSLVLRVTKPTKIKSISLKFRGVSRTEWPEGIPPKKIETFESKDIYSHVWPFFSAQLPQAENGSGAHVVQPLENELSAMASALPRGRSERSGGSSTVDSRSRSRSSTIEQFSVFHRRPTSPSPGPRTGDVMAKGYRNFQPAEYIYSFELAIPQMLSETTKCNFGQIKYLFELQIERSGTFKSNLIGSRDLTILRTLGMSNLEYSEPIVISRDWEDQLHYEIAIAGKAFVIGSSIPIAFSFVPLAKVRCHRIRVYITEHTEYFCKNRKVHRVEPVHKFMLLEKVSDKGIHNSLLQESTDSSRLTAFEFNVQIPHNFKNRRDRLHPNANVGTIKVHHWIKVVLRLSRAQPDSATGKVKYYEVSIDSPITLLDPRTVTANTLPQYETNSEEQPHHLRPYQDYLEHQIERPIYLMREPSIAPPPFDAEDGPPNVFPPRYDNLQDSPDNYVRRYEAYQARVHGLDSHDADGEPHFSDIIWRDDESDELVHAGADSGDSGDGSTRQEYAVAMVDEVESHSPLHSPLATPPVRTPLRTPLRTPTEFTAGHSPVSSLGRSPLSPGDTTAPTSTDSTASMPAEPAAPGFPFLLHHEQSSNLEQPSSSSLTSTGVPESSAAPNSSISATTKLSLDTRFEGRRDISDHPYLPLSPRTNPGWAARHGSATSVHSLPRNSAGPSMRPGSALRDARDARSRMGSTSSLRSPRYYRQSSMVSVDLVDQAGQQAGRRGSRVTNLSEVEDVTDWYANGRNDSVSSLGVSVFEYQRPDQNPLLPHDGRNASIISADLADFDYEDDVASVYSNHSSFIRPQPFFHT